MLLPNNSPLQGGKYKIVRHISSGGFGNTYEGIHGMMDTRVAIKEFFVKSFCNRDETTGSVTVTSKTNEKTVEKLQEKFTKEAKSIYKMFHENIVRVTDIFAENGTVYYVMDYIDGCSLSDVLKQKGKLSEAEALGYIRQVAGALKYVHGLNRLHLDIKPGNIMLTKEGVVKLIDFGASKHYDEETGENTSTLIGINTKGYAPVEQSVQGFSTFSPATDIYALGATFYKLLTGITPPDANLLMVEAETLQPLPSGVSSATRKAIEAAMKVKCKDRPQTIDEFLAILDGNASDDESTQLDNSQPVAVTSVPVQTPVVEKVEPEAEVNHGYEQPEWEDEEKKSPLLKWGIIGGIVIAAIVAAVFLLLPSKGSLKVDYLPEGSTVVLDKKDTLGVTPNTFADIEPGYHRVDILSEGLADQLVWIEIEKGQEFSLNGELREKNDSLDFFVTYNSTLQKAAEAGNTIAQTDLGLCYELGFGVEQDKQTAVEWFRKAVEQGYDRAQRNLGNCYYYGWGVEKDMNKALEWWRKAAEQGDADAQGNLGASYATGEGVEKNMNKAVEWYRKAAEQGIAYAQNNLGWCYVNGEGVEKDMNKAIEWYKKAADQGDETAINNLRNLGVAGY